MIRGEVLTLRPGDVLLLNTAYAEPSYWVVLKLWANSVEASLECVYDVDPDYIGVSYIMRHPSSFTLYCKAP